MSHLENHRVRLSFDFFEANKIGKVIIILAVIFAIFGAIVLALLAAWIFHQQRRKYTLLKNSQVHFRSNIQSPTQGSSVLPTTSGPAATTTKVAPAPASTQVVAPTRPSQGRPSIPLKETTTIGQFSKFPLMFRNNSRGVHKR